MTPMGSGPPPDELDRHLSAALQLRRLIIRVLIAIFLVLPAAGLAVHQGLTGQAAFLVPATAVFVVLVDRWVLASHPGPGRRPRGSMAALSVVVVLGAALFAVGQMNWLTALAVAAAAAGRFAASQRRAFTGVAACSALGLGLSVWQHFPYGATLAAFLVPVLAGVLAYAAERRNVLMYELNQTRAELARMAVAQERQRISRDLHDLLGHSLSLIALKSELAGRTIASDPRQAAQEIAEVEAVARRSLADVRRAVTGYRQPSLAAELAAARRMLASAGIDCRVEAPGAYQLPPEVDALLAWTVREGATNVVRHSGARRAEIRVEVTGTHASAELADDGAGVAGAQAGREAGPATPGSGLAGLAERAARLGGTLATGTGADGGFRLRVSSPLTPAQAGADARPAAVPLPARGPVAS